MALYETEDSESSAALRHQLAQFEAIHASLQDAVYIVDTTGVIIYCNSALTALTGYEPAELLQRPSETLYVPEVRDLLRARRFQAFAGETRLPPLETFLVRQDQSYIPVELVVTNFVQAGQLCGRIAVVRDIRERKRAEEQFRGLLESAPDAMVIVNATGQIMLVNSQTERLFGYPRQALLGQPVELLMPTRFRAQHLAHRNRFFVDPHMRSMGADLELYGCRQDGTEFPIEIMLSPLTTAQGMVVSSAIRDISKRKRAEQRLLDSLREKEILLKETHHRVKNNLAVISSLLYLQSIYTQDEPTLKMLRESQDRIRSMSLVHEALYRSENFAAVDFADYVGALSQQLLRTYSLSGSIQLKTDLEPVHMNLELAIPCGLILNELVTNAIKHAFPAGQAGEIRVTLRQYDTDAYSLQVADNGVGLPDALAAATVTSLGLRLIRVLTRQIDGQFELVATYPGTEARLTLGAQRDAEQA